MKTQEVRYRVRYRFSVTDWYTAPVLTYEEALEEYRHMAPLYDDVAIVKETITREVVRDDG